jgi:hypothetical protein
MMPMRDSGYTITLRDRVDVVNVDFGFACIVTNVDGAAPDYWLSGAGRAALAAADQLLPEGRGRGGFGGGRGAAGGWRALVNRTLALSDGSDGRFEVTGQGSFDEAYDELARWLRVAPAGTVWTRASAALATTALNVAWGAQPGTMTVLDPVRNDWPAIDELVDRLAALIAERLDGRSSATATVEADAYATLLEALNGNRAQVTPARPERCPPPF